LKGGEKMKLKEHEKELISHMRHGKRLNVSKIARKLSLPISTVSDRIRKIEKNYVVKRASILDYHKVGYLANAQIAFRLEAHKKKPFLEFLKNEECVNMISHINSGYDFLVEIVCRDAIELKSWLESVHAGFSPGVIIFQVLKVEDKERFVPR
jgi:Lrp/AsnC family transcriptional regulator for asnA, asnC and gidA